MRVFVAGATGVLGTAVVRRLVAGGHEVTGIGRGPEKRRALAEAGAQAVAADLFEPAAIRAAVEGHDVVCNLATRIPSGTAMMRGSAWRENDRVRTEGSANLARAAADCNVLRYIQEAVSFVYADAGENWITEASRVEPSAITASSLVAAQNAMDIADQYRFAVVLRFGLLYGDDAITRWQLDRVRRGKPVLVGEPAGYLSPISVDDAAAAVLAALSAPTGVYNVAGTPVRREEWARALGTAAGVDTPAKFLSPLVVKMLGSRLESARRSQRVSSDAFYTATGWRARSGLAAGFTAVTQPATLT